MGRRDAIVIGIESCAVSEVRITCMLTAWSGCWCSKVVERNGGLESEFLHARLIRPLLKHPLFRLDSSSDW